MAHGEVEYVQPGKLISVQRMKVADNYCEQMRLSILCSSSLKRFLFGAHHMSLKLEIPRPTALTQAALDFP